MDSSRLEFRCRIAAREYSIRIGIGRRGFYFTGGITESLDRTDSLVRLAIALCWSRI